MHLSQAAMDMNSTPFTGSGGPGIGPLQGCPLDDPYASMTDGMNIHEQFITGKWF